MYRSPRQVNEALSFLHRRFDDVRSIFLAPISFCEGYGKTQPGCGSIANRSLRQKKSYEFGDVAPLESLRNQFNADSNPS